LRKGILIALAILIVFGVISVAISPKDEYYTVKLETSETVFHVGDEMTVTMSFSNHSIGIYKATFLNDTFNLSVSKVDDNYGYLQLPSYQYILPLRTVKESKTHTFSDTGSYLVQVYVSFSSEGKDFSLSDSVIVEVLS